MECAQCLAGGSYDPRHNRWSVTADYRPAADTANTPSLRQSCSQSRRKGWQAVRTRARNRFPENINSIPVEI